MNFPTGKGSRKLLNDNIININILIKYIYRSNGKKDIHFKKSREISEEWGMAEFTVLLFYQGNIFYSKNA
jgi:hypothetical protein